MSTVSPIPPVPHASLLKRAEAAAVAAMESVLGGTLAEESAPTVAPAVVTQADVAKTVVKAAVALVQAEKPIEPPAKPVGPSWKFVKIFGVGDVIRFADKTTFKFRLVRLNDGSGFSNSSEVVTSDEALASNLRAAAKNPAAGIVEVK